jgi:hypothetical protein
VAHERVEHRPQPGNPGIGVLQLSVLLEDERAQRFDVVGKVCLGQHEAC